MRYRPLGSTGHQVSEVGLGTYPLGGTLITSGSYWSGPATYGEVSLKTAVETIHHGLSLGLNFIDTAPVYSEAEVYIAEALRRRPSHLRDIEVFVETKGGEHVLPAADGGSPVLARDFSRAALRASVQRSKERLQTDLIEGVLLHSPVADEMAEDPLGLLVELRAERHIGHVGVSATNVTEAIRLIEEDGRAEIIQIGFSLLEPEPTERLLPLAEERGIGIVIRSPLASGFLSGTLTADHEFGPDDHRSLIPRERLAARLREAESFMWLVDEGVAQSLSEAALRYILSFSGVTSVIPGAMNPAELEQNVAISDLGPLPEAALARVAETQRELGLLS